MKKNNPRRFVLNLAMFLTVLAFFVGCRVSGERQPPSHVSTEIGRPNQARQDTTAPVVSPVSGSSWIKRIGLQRPGQTAMGQMGGKEPAPAAVRDEPDLPRAGSSGRGGMMGRRMGGIIERILSWFHSEEVTPAQYMNETFMLTGADLYRLNCQSCHGPGGVGAPPEIKSLLDPVRAMSPALTQQRMEKLGRPIDAEFARELAAGAGATLRQRLVEGGEKMPPFRHLRGDEVDALLAYLQELAGAPAAESKEILVPQSVARVGEHVVKGTCRICHAATGPGAGRMGMMRGVISSLASFPREMSLQQVIRQTRSGSSGMMGMMRMDKMPAFPYFTENEIAAAYLYLLAYPPQE
jgi:mono/diheme cytochrome c family protein